MAKEDDSKTLVEAVVIRGSFRALNADGERVEYLPAEAGKPPTIVKVTERQLLAFSGVLAKRGAASEAEIAAAADENLRSTSSSKEATDPPTKEVDKSKK